MKGNPPPAQPSGGGGGGDGGEEALPLRRATYTTIEKLIFSQYEVDLKRLEHELSQVRTTTATASSTNSSPPPPPAEAGEAASTTATSAPLSSPPLKQDNDESAKETGTDDKDATPEQDEPHHYHEHENERQDDQEEDKDKDELLIPEVSTELTESLTTRPRTGSSSTSPSSRAWSTGGGDNPSHYSVGSSQQHLHQAKYPHHNRLQPPRDGFNLCLLVGKVEIVVDKFRVDGTRVLVAEVEVGDETGSISLRARDEQIDLLRSVSEDGGAVVLRNCTMELYQGRHLRLAVSKWGKMCIYPDGIESTPDPPKSINKDLNFSLVDLNNVATSKVIIEPLPPSVSTSGKGRKQHHHQHSSPKYTSFKVDEDSPSRNPRHRPRRYQYQRKKNYPHHNNNNSHSHYHHHHPNMSPPSPLNPQHLYHGHSGRGSDPPIIGGLPPHMSMHHHYPQYPSGGASVDASYSSYQSQQPLPPQQRRDHHNQQGGVPPPPHRQFLPSDHYKRQQEILYQQYEMQQHHAHQMHMLQHQQETQRRILEQHQHHTMGHQGTSVIPDINRVESHGSAAEFSLGSSFPPLSSPSMSSTQAPSMGIGPEYQFSLHGVGGGEGGGPVQPPRNYVPSFDNSQYQLSTATIISPPMSPQHFGHPGPVHTIPDGSSRVESAGRHRHAYEGTSSTSSSSARHRDRQYNSGPK